MILKSFIKIKPMVQDFSQTICKLVELLTQRSHSVNELRKTNFGALSAFRLVQERPKA